MVFVESPPDEVVDYFPKGLREKYLLAEKIEQLKLSKDAKPSQIGWEPNWEEFQERLRERQTDEELQKEVPAGWPDQLEGPLVWHGQDLIQSEYVLELSVEERIEVIQAMSSCKKLGLGLGEIDRSNFKLPLLEPKLETLCNDVHEGRGFVVLRGWESPRFSKLENSIVFVGISSYIAECRGRQNQRGMMLTHITDITPVAAPESKLRSAYSNIGQPFHSDLLCGVLALFCESPAAQGGETLLAPSWTVYNEIAKERPDIIHVLQKDNWVHDTHGRNPPYHHRPLLHLNEESKPLLVFARRVLTGSRETPRTPGIPPLLDEQAEALDAVHFAASKHSLEINLQAGDMLFINNFAVLHSRKAFVDSKQTKRYFMRLWLSNKEKAWGIPESLWLPWDRIFGHLAEVRNYWDHDPFREESNPDPNPHPPIVFSTSCG
ncbi:hypothetical protein FQN57_002572 [Myotisia sp. PD_48]|nr:hypothetical protein FQN57_002572 [Myotisia sp. PD_48]